MPRYGDRLLITLCRHFGEHFTLTRSHGVPFRMLELALNRQTVNQLIETVFSKLVVGVHSDLGSDAGLAAFLCAIERRS